MSLRHTELKLIRIHTTKTEGTKSTKAKNIQQNAQHFHTTQNLASGEQGHKDLLKHTGRAASKVIASIKNMAFQAGLRLKNCNI